MHRWSSPVYLQRVAGHRLVPIEVGAAHLNANEGGVNEQQVRRGEVGNGLLLIDPTPPQTQTPTLTAPPSADLTETPTNLDPTQPI